MLKKKVSVYSLLAIVFTASLCVYFVTAYFYNQKPEDPLEKEHTNYKITRMQGSKYIKPLVSAKPVSESGKFSDIKKSVTDIINSYKNKSLISSASVYFRDFDQSDWCVVNEYDKYMCGSLLKIPELIAFLKMEEAHPGTLDRKIAYNQLLTSDKTQRIKSKSVVMGQVYSIKELLGYMIEYSDNNATMLLNQNLDVNVFKKVFTDLGLAPVDWNAKTYYLTVKDCSIFLESLYNASYLTVPHSEFAVELLSKSDYSDGILKGIPNENLRVAHKFAEAGTDLDKELHETAVFYIKDNAYLLTIMTKGNSKIELPVLAKAIQEISGKVYSGLTSLN